MMSPLRWCCRIVAVLPLLAGLFVVPAHAQEIWVAPTYQQDLGGLGIGSNGIWPVTAIGAVRLAWAIPNDLATFQSAKVALIPHSPGGAATLNVFVCAAQNGQSVIGACAGPFTQPFTGVPNQLLEVDISAAIAPSLGVAGANYVAVVAFTSPTTATDHIVGLRFAYGSNGGTPAGMVAFFAGTTCPSGWTEYASARGRVVVGLPFGGTPEATLGIPLTNLASRTISDVPNHLHAVDPPSIATTASGTHSHTFTAGGIGFDQNAVSAGLVANGSRSTSTAPNHTHNVDIGVFNSGSTGSASVDVSMPYLQLIACRRS